MAVSAFPDWLDRTQKPNPGAEKAPNRSAVLIPARMMGS